MLSESQIIAIAIRWIGITGTTGATLNSVDSKPNPLVIAGWQFVADKKGGGIGTLEVEKGYFLRWINDDDLRSPFTI